MLDVIAPRRARRRPARRPRSATASTGCCSARWPPTPTRSGASTPRRSSRWSPTTPSTAPTCSATLETYLANDCNMNATARAVYAHRHTVAHRLGADPRADGPRPGAGRRPRAPGPGPQGLPDRRADPAEVVIRHPSQSRPRPGECGRRRRSRRPRCCEWRLGADLVAGTVLLAKRVLPGNHPPQDLILIMTGYTRTPSVAATVASLHGFRGRGATYEPTMPVELAGFSGLQLNGQDPRGKAHLHSLQPAHAQSDGARGRDRDGWSGTRLPVHHLERPWADSRGARQQHRDVRQSNSPPSCPGQTRCLRGSGSPQSDEEDRDETAASASLPRRLRREPDTCRSSRGSSRA